MSLNAHITADAATFSFLSGDGSAASVETPFHRLVILVEDETGAVLRSIEQFVDGRLDVRGQGEDPHHIGQPPHPKGESYGDEPAPADDMAGQGFAALNPAGASEPETGHEDPAGEPAEQGEVRP